MIGVLRRLSRYRPHAVVETAAAAEGRLGLLAQVAATWCVLAALDLALNLTLPESEGRSGLPLPAQLAAVCADLAGLTLALLAAVGAGLLVGPVGRRLPLPAPVRAVLMGRRPMLVWVLVLGYGRRSDGAWSEFGLLLRIGFALRCFLRSVYLCNCGDDSDHGEKSKSTDNEERHRAR